METKFSQLELCEPESASTRLIETVTGTHRFKVEGYSFDWISRCDEYTVKSDMFTIGGYEYVIEYSSKDSILSFKLDLQSESKMVKARVDFILLDQRGNPSTLRQSIVWDCFDSIPCPYYVRRDTFESSDCLKDDSFTLLCTVTILKRSHVESGTKPKAVEVPPSNIGKHLSHLLETGEGADVSFEVSGEVFNVHKWLLAARSPVFRAQFFGSMNKEGGKNIKLSDIEPGVFRVLIHFIYTDFVPEFEGDIERDETFMCQHLLAAADRYEVERLKIICQNKLSQNIDVENFATTLALAVQHNCAQLKTSCLEFVSSPKTLVEVMKTDGFEHLTQSCPSILKELLGTTSNDK